MNKHSDRVYCFIGIQTERKKVVIEVCKKTTTWNVEVGKTPAHLVESKITHFPAETIIIHPAETKWICPAERKITHLSAETEIMLLAETKWICPAETKITHLAETKQLEATKRTQLAKTNRTHIEKPEINQQYRKKEHTFKKQKNTHWRT